MPEECEKCGLSAAVFGLLALMWINGNNASGVILFAATGFGLAAILVIQWILSRLTMNLLCRIGRLEGGSPERRDNQRSEE